MTETTRRRLDAERRTAAAARQTSRQRRGVVLLGEMLARAAAEGLPAIGRVRRESERRWRCRGRRRRLPGRHRGDC
jgi:hypothetical protein